MKIALQIVIILCAFLAIGKAEEATPLGNEIISDISSGRVDYVKVFLTKEGAEYVVSLNEEKLEKWGTTVTIKKFSQHKATPLLLKVLQSLRLNSKIENLDLRCGCKFFDSQGKIIHTLYIDNFLTRGKFDGKQVIISKKIKDWIDAVRNELNQKSETIPAQGAKRDDYRGPEP